MKENPITCDNIRELLIHSLLTNISFPDLVACDNTMNPTCAMCNQLTGEWELWMNHTQLTKADCQHGK